MAGRPPKPPADHLRLAEGRFGDPAACWTGGKQGKSHHRWLCPTKRGHIGGNRFDYESGYRPSRAGVDAPKRHGRRVRHG